MRMKIIISILFVGILISCSSKRTITEVNRSTVKSIYTAAYSDRSNLKLSRKSVLKEQPMQKEIFNKRGELIKFIQYDTDGSIYQTTIYHLNEKGYLIKREVFDKQNNLEYYVVTEFNNNDNIVFYRTFNSKNEITDIQENQYDSLGNIIVILNTNTDRTQTFKTTQTYNSKNQLIERICYNSDGSIQDKRTFTYDARENEVLSDLTRPDGEYTKFVSEYDSLNNIITQHWFDKDGKQIHWNSFSYVYDKKGYWITRKRYSDGKLNFVWERQIEYN